MAAPTSGPASPSRTPAPAEGGFLAAAALDPLDRTAFELAIAEEIEQADPEADLVELADRAMARIRRWKARSAAGSVMAPFDRCRTLGMLGALAARPHPDRRLVEACERLLLGAAGALNETGLQDRVARTHARTAMGRRAKAEVALALLDNSDLPAATLARSVILEALAGLPADRG